MENKTYKAVPITEELLKKITEEFNFIGTEKRNTQQGFLTGKSAEKFLKQVKENENKKASPEELARIKANYEIMQKNY